MPRYLYSAVMVAALAAGMTLPALAQMRYPFTLDNCGVAVTIESPPRRAVAIKSTAIEMLLALGLADRLVGTAFADGPVPEPWAAEVPVLSDKLPAQEVVLETEPDFIYGGWESNFSGDGAGERGSLATLGLDSYVSPAACRTSKPAKLGFEDVFAQIEEMGRIFDVETNAEALVHQQRAQLASVEPDGRGLTALWYSSGTKTPSVGAGSGAPEMMLEGLGLRNIMSDVSEGWLSARWEAIADADPDVIVLVDASWNSAEQKRQLLAENPITSQLEAVKNGRYLVVPFPASEAGVRNASAVVDMAKQLAALDAGN